MKQFSLLVAKSNFQFKAPGAKGRAVKVSTGDRFLVTSPLHSNNETVLIAREKGARLNDGYRFAVDTLANYFTPEKESDSL